MEGSCCGGGCGYSNQEKEVSELGGFLELAEELKRFTSATNRLAIELTIMGATVYFHTENDGREIGLDITISI